MSRGPDVARLMSHLELTPTEEKVALCLGEGLKAKEICEVLGWGRPRYVSNIIKTVKDKIATAKLNEEERRKAGFSTLKRAHGRIGLDGSK